MAGAADDLLCLTQSEKSEVALYAHLQQMAYAALDRRENNFEQLKSPEQIRAHQQRLRAILVK
jgi:hypothetical protein